jgi:hypothetical protein
MEARIPRVAHLVIALAHGGLERLVVDWTNARNRRYPGSTVIWCLDAPGELAVQVEGDAVWCAEAERARFPWDRAAVRRMKSNGASHGTLDVVHSHNLAAQQYAALVTRGTSMRHVHTQHGANLHNLGLKDRVRSRLLAC